jgi:hypothetical protein
VVQIEIVAVENVPAILAGVFIPFEDIVPRKFYFFLRQPIEKEQHDDSRHANLPGNGRDQFVIGRRSGKITPTVEIMGQKVVGRVGRNDMGVPGVNKGESAARRANVDRLPETVQDQNLTI